MNTLVEMDLRAAARSLVESIIQSSTDEILLLPDSLIDQSTVQDNISKLLNLFEGETGPRSDDLV